MARVGIYGWGVVAPRSPNVEAFAANLESNETWLTLFEDPGPTTFLVGEPEFDFGDYRSWIDARFAPSKYPQLRQKMGAPTLYAIGAFVQALGQNPGLEEVLQELGTEAQVMVGTGLGDLPTIYDCSVELYRTRLEWDRFWAEPERNADRRRYERGSAAKRQELQQLWAVPPDPRELGGEVEDDAVGDGPDGPPARRQVEDAWQQWNAFWMRRSDGLLDFLDAFNAIEDQPVEGGEIEAAKLRSIRAKKTAFERLLRETGCPTPPWMAVSPNLIWNIANTPAAQISMLGQITGPAYCPVAACSTFSVCLGLGMDAIRAGDAKAVIIGATDPPPHMLAIGAFYKARVLASDRRASVPLTDLRGTHVSGGSCIWILGDHDFMRERGFEPLGMELLGIGVSSDADHIITPSEEGPQEAIRASLLDAGVDPAEIGTWDLHATATPGDYLEVANLRPIFAGGLALTARKGTFGHGMSAGGGWELMAQHLGLAQGELFPTPLRAGDLNPEIEALPYEFVVDVPCPAPDGVAGKLSMGIGGINACVLSRPWGTERQDVSA